VRRNKKGKVHPEKFAAAARWAEYIISDFF
jgi:hypothetical protein